MRLPFPRSVPRISGFLTKQCIDDDFPRVQVLRIDVVLLQLNCDVK